jgi:hypothetical protein
MLVGCAYCLAYGSSAYCAASIPLFSEELQKAVDPADPPFAAIYRSGHKVLGFVAADHVFTPENDTIATVRRAFTEIHPLLVIVEGFPTTFGPNPTFIVAELRRRADPGATTYSQSEGGFTAQLALEHMVPFLGGEPTPAEELGGLESKGYLRNDVLTAFLLRGLGQERRAGGMPPGDSAAFATAYTQGARSVSAMTKTELVPQEQFTANYRRLVGIDPVSDSDLATRYDPGTDTLLHRMGADNMRVRDEHLLNTIFEQSATYDRVLVVYGSGHWTTLSAALEERFGRPAVLTPKKKAHLQ